MPKIQTEYGSKPKNTERTPLYGQKYRQNTALMPKIQTEHGSKPKNTDRTRL